ncbi:MAG: hypothetical protein R3F39_21580 [Myxococcota bacterium]
MSAGSQILTLALALALALAAAPAPSAHARPQASSAKSAKPSKSQPKKSSKPAADPAAEAPPAATAPEGAEPSLRRSNRMELDARLIQGSTPEAGAVYLFQRAPRNLPALVRLRQSYLREIVLPVLGPERATIQAAPTAPTAPAEAKTP